MAPVTATTPPRCSRPRGDLPRCLLPASPRGGEPGSGEGVTAKRVMGTARGAVGTFRRPLEAPYPAPQLLPWRCATTTFSSPWVQKVCRGDKGTPPQQSQPGPEHPTHQTAGTAAASRSPEHSSRLGGDGSLHPGVWGWHEVTQWGRARGQWLGCRTTHRQGHLLHRWLPVPPAAGRQPGLPGGPGLPVTPPGSPSPTQRPLPRPLPVPTSGAGTGGRGQIATRPNLPKGLLHRAGSSAFPRPGWRRARGGGQPVGTGCPGHPPPQGGDPHPRCPPCPGSSSSYWEPPPHATPGRTAEGAAWPWQGPGTPTSSPAASGALTPAGSGGDQHPQRYGAQPVLSFSSSFLFLFVLFFFALGDPEPGPGSCHHHDRHAPPHPCPQGGETGRAAAACRPGAVRRRSLLLWPGPSALCLCPAVRLSCSLSLGGPRSAQSRGGHSLRSGRSS